MHAKLRLSDFDFKLPQELIAQKPTSPRNHARLLVYDRRSNKITDDYFYNLDKFLIPSSALVLNNSKVEKARLLLGNTEIFVLETINPYTVSALVKPGRKFKLGLTVSLTNDLSATVLAVDETGVRTLKLSLPLNDKKLDKFRHTPLPPYIEQNELLASDYQTVYAKPAGSKAAPTAGLHFTQTQLNALSMNHDIVQLTLHVGLGTFAPVKTEDIALHKMHKEDYCVSAKAASSLNVASHITAVGTTSVRVLETLGRPFWEVEGSTDIFIAPGYKFKAADSMITNFHLPKSTLLMLVAAFVGSVNELHRIYAHATAQQYRFYSFGDTMLIL